MTLRLTSAFGIIFSFLVLALTQNVQMAFSFAQTYNKKSFSIPPFGLLVYSLFLPLGALLFSILISYLGKSGKFGSEKEHERFKNICEFLIIISIVSFLFWVISVILYLNSTWNSWMYTLNQTNQTAT